MLKPSLKVQEENGLLVVEFFDCLRLDPAPVKDLRKAFENHRRQHGRPIVLVDLSGVGFAGSAALGGFLSLRRDGARVLFFNVDPTVYEVFRVSHLDTLFSFANDLNAAVALAQQEAASAHPAEKAKEGDSGTPAARPEKDATPRGSSSAGGPLRRSRDRN